MEFSNIRCKYTCAIPAVQRVNCRIKPQKLKAEVYDRLKKNQFDYEHLTNFKSKITLKHSRFLTAGEALLHFLHLGVGKLVGKKGLVKASQTITESNFFLHQDRKKKKRFL